MRIKKNSKLCVRNLPDPVTENELATLFAKAGTVVFVDIIKDRATGHSKGFGFIEMSSQVQAENAVEMFNGWTLDNCPLHVSLAQHRETRDGS
jgi:RNA recognition motif-containing protein